MPVKGHAASDPQGEIDLALDPDQDALEIDPQGEVLIVTPPTEWVGQTASETL
jgi:hypothetical protein